MLRGNNKKLMDENMTKMNMELIQFYENAKQYCIDHGYQHEIDIVMERKFHNQTHETFLFEYIFVVVSSGMKNQVAQGIFESCKKIGSKAIGHPGKRKAVVKAQLYYKTWFRELKSCGSIQEKLDYLETLPWIGPITKYHLARNLGIDVAKPDRHLKRIAEHFGYTDRKILENEDLKRKIKLDIICGYSPESALKLHGISTLDDAQYVQWMCEDISKKVGDRTGVVDVVLWRAMSLSNGKIMENKPDIKVIGAGE